MIKLKIKTGKALNYENIDLTLEDIVRMVAKERGIDFPAGVLENFVYDAELQVSKANGDTIIASTCIDGDFEDKDRYTSILVDAIIDNELYYGAMLELPYEADKEHTSGVVYVYGENEVTGIDSPTAIVSLEKRAEDDESNKIVFIDRQFVSAYSDQVVEYPRNISTENALASARLKEAEERMKREKERMEQHTNEG